MKLINDTFVVVSDYNVLPDNIEDSWVHKFCNNYLIYDRAHRWEESNNTKRQLNLGQNIYDIFDFILTHYDNIPDYTAFCRAAIMNPKDNGSGKKNNGNCSEENFIKFVNQKAFTELHDFGPEVHDGFSSKFGPDGSYLEYNNSWYFNHVQSKYFNNYNTFLQHIYVNPELPEYIRFSPGGCYVIPKENILKYSKKFYEYLRYLLSWDVVVGEAHMLERALYTIFTCNYTVQPEFI